MKPKETFHFSQELPDRSTIAQNPITGCLPQTDAAQVTPENDRLVNPRGTLVNILPREKQGRWLLIPQSPGPQVHVAVKS